LLLRDRLLQALPFSAGELDMLIWSAPLRYKTYWIEKRQPGKYRQISQPTPEVKLLQRWLINNFFSKFPVHNAARAYREGIGLAANVQPHAKNRFLLKVDFKEFFPSIKANHFVEFMRSNGCTPEDIDVSRYICFKRDRVQGELHLAIGAPSSPMLSNIMLCNLDSEIARLAEDHAVTYTRYADDLSFSCAETNVLRRIEVALPDLIKESCVVPLEINPQKTIHASKKNGRTITGIVITPEGDLSVGYQRKRLLRAQIYRYKIGTLPSEDIECLRGYIAFLNSIEPDHIRRLVAKYGFPVMSQLFPGLTP
jgi:RNA-directed DNA polymerase